MEVALAVVVLAVVVALVVAVPLRRGPDVDRREDEQRAAELEARKESKYREIRDAELDRAAGKLSDLDFESVDAELRREAVDILKDLDAAESELRRERAG